jgi:uncharacterized protein (DUF1684 family)
MSCQQWGLVPFWAREGAKLRPQINAQAEAIEEKATFRRAFRRQRYLEPVPLGNGQFMVDFNLAYNPYCAYNDHWPCPLTPRENRLVVPIRAGEKLYEAD